MESQATGSVEVPCVLTGQRGALSRIHLYKAEPVENEWGAEVVVTLCGVTGFTTTVDLSADPRAICRVCAGRP